MILVLRALDVENLAADFEVSFDDSFSFWEKGKTSIVASPFFFNFASAPVKKSPCAPLGDALFL